MSCLRHRAPLLALALVLGSGPALAGDESKEPLATDRPDITETGSVIGRRKIQIETSVLRERLRGGGTTTRTWASPTLFRVGLDSRWEARLETDGYVRQRLTRRGSGATTSGMAPLSPGVKFQVREPGESLVDPAIAAILHVQVPSGSSQFDDHRFGGDLKLAFDFELSPRWSLGVNVGVAAGPDDRGRTFAAGLATAALARELSSRLRAYLELAHQSAESRRGGAALIFDGGIAYLINADLQLDLALGTGLAGRSPAGFFWTAGVSVRF